MRESDSVKLRIIAGCRGSPCVGFYLRSEVAATNERESLIRDYCPNLGAVRTFSFFHFSFFFFSFFAQPN